jgi:hypothetical protein
VTELTASASGVTFLVVSLNLVQSATVTVILAGGFATWLAGTFSKSSALRAVGMGALTAGMILGLALSLSREDWIWAGVNLAGVCLSLWGRRKAATP